MKKNPTTQLHTAANQFVDALQAMSQPIHPATLTEIAVTAVQLYATTHPRPAQVTAKQAAEMLGISRHAVTKLLKNGTLKLNKCALITTADIDLLLKTNPP